MSSTNLLDEYFSDHTLAAELGVHHRTVYRWHILREGPPATVIGRNRYYRKDSVRDWLKSREQTRPVRRATK